MEESRLARIKEVQNEKVAQVKHQKNLAQMAQENHAEEIPDPKADPKATDS